MSAEFGALLQEHPGGPGGGDRRAALALHTMGASDREWIWQQLTQAQQAILQPLLAELRDIDFGGPSDAPAADASADIPLTAQSPAQPVDESPHAMLRALSVQQARILLTPEPDALVADVLRQGPFPWQADFLALLPLRRRSIEAAMDSASGPCPRRLDAVLRAVSKRIADAVSEPAKATAPADRAPLALTTRIRRLFSRTGGTS